MPPPPPPQQQPPPPPPPPTEQPEPEPEPPQLGMELFSIGDSLYERFAAHAVARPADVT